ncbi:hypothetical protein GQ53DRAFT_756661 [Thozetella sp. PMI_491]|nr:hypothetical protein GQ53DRAFT_756661 [Thozetella sp. PMI_491]
MWRTWSGCGAYRKWATIGPSCMRAGFSWLAPRLAERLTGAAGCFRMLRLKRKHAVMDRTSPCGLLEARACHGACPRGKR